MQDPAHITAARKMEAIAATSLAFVSLQFLVSVAVSAFLVRKRNDVSMVDKLLVLWLVFDAVVHFTLVRVDLGNVMYM